jgi:hypothetical protein
MNQKPDKLIPALYGGIIMALISAIPFINFINCLCCAGVMLGGFFAVFFYKNNFTPDTPPYTSGECMGLGAMAGVFGAIIGTVLSVAVLALFGNITSEYMVDILKNSGLDIPTEAFDAMEESMAAGLSFGSVMIQLFASLVIDSLFGLLGGLIGYSVYKPKKPMMPTPMPQPPQV